MSINNHPMLANEPNLALEFLGKAHNQVSQNIEDRINAGIDKLLELNKQNRALNKLLAALNLASVNGNDSKEGGADFSQNHEIKLAIDAIIDFAPDIFGHINFEKGEQYFWDSNNAISKTIENISMHVDINARTVYQVEMFMKLDTENQTRITECSQKTLDALIRYVEKIIARFRTHS